MPQEHELARAVLERMEREKALATLLLIHNLEETKRKKRERIMDEGGRLFLLVLMVLIGLDWYKQVTNLYFRSLEFALFVFSLFGVFTLMGAASARSPLQKNVVRALFRYTDSPLSADPLCRALTYLHDEPALHPHLQDVLLILPNEKEALSAEARKFLRECLWITTEPYDVQRTTEMLATMSAQKKIEYRVKSARHVDFQIDILDYLVRVQDAEVIPKLRHVVDAAPLHDEHKRLQTAARAALQAFGESVA